MHRGDAAAATRIFRHRYNATDRPPIAAPRRTYKVPRGMPDLAYSDSNANFDFGSYGHHYHNAGPGHPMPRADAAVARRGAAAAITHLDGCIGEVLAALDASPRANTTLVVFRVVTNFAATPRGGRGNSGDRLFRWALSRRRRGHDMDRPWRGRPED